MHNRKERILIVLTTTVAAICIMAFASCSLSDGNNLSKNNESSNITENYTIGLQFSELDDGTLMVYADISCKEERSMLRKKEVVIPTYYMGKKVTSIPDFGFAYNDNLTSISIPDSITSIGSGAFLSCDNLQYYEKDNCYYLGNETNNYVVLIKAKSTKITTVTIDDNTKVIYSSAFNGCSNLTSITIPDSVISIGDNAFCDCSSLTSITIPDSVTSIGCTAFDGCPCTEEVNGIQYVDKWAVGVDTSITTVVIRNGTKGIAFVLSYGSAIRSVIIPDSVTRIEHSAFILCYIEKVYYKGNDKNNITIDYYYNDSLISATWYYYSETKPNKSGNYWHYDSDGTTIIEW